MAIRNNHLEVCKWIHSTFNLTDMDVRDLLWFGRCYTAQKHYLEIYRWLRATFFC
jgi:hypothetical protein